MAFIERQKKGNSTYYYLTQTIRRNTKFKKVRVLLSEKQLAKAQLQQRLKEAQPHLQEKIAQQKQEPLFPIVVDEAKLSDKYLIWERPCSPFLVYQAAVGIVNPQIKNYGYGWGKTHGFFQNNMVRFVWDLKYFTKNGLHIINNMMRRDHYQHSMKVVKEQTRRVRELIVNFTNPTSLTNKELVQRLQEFDKVMIDWWGTTQVSECISVAAEYLLKQVINEKKISLITTPSKKSYSTIEEEDMLKIALLIEKEKPLLKAFRLKSPAQLMEEMQKYPHLRQRLLEHAKRYYWILNNYLTIQYCNEQYFIEQLQKILRSVEKPAALLQKTEFRMKEIKETKKAELAQLPLNEKYKKLALLAEQMAIFQDERKAVSLGAHHYLYEYLKELSRRTGIETRLLSYSLPSEYEKILSGTFNTTLLLQRQQGCVMVLDEEGLQMKTGVEYHKLYDSFFAGRNKQQITEFEGRRAEGGKVVGKVRIILDPRCAGQFKSGEILVTTMTSPDFLPLMKRASAIITDEGGITCHAAIVSRELGIPCVVGTRVATQILKNGDSVEVNANHGIIKIKR